MKSHETTEVYSYLSYLEHYLTGDLHTFHKICGEAEKNNSNPSLAETGSNAGSMYREPEPITTTSATAQTTIYPVAGVTQYSSFSNNQDVFRLTIPVTLTLFATIDYLGYLSGDNNNARDTDKNFLEFLKQSSIAVTESESKFLNQVFRQGLTHVYFPKLGLGISYHSQNPTDKLFFKNSDGKLVLNVNRLEEIVITTFNSIKGNQSLYSRMDSRYQNLISDYKDKYEKE